MTCFFKDNYDKFDGFVVLHGTDTMSYTAAALSFMLEYLGKPVILTGSQVTDTTVTYSIGFSEEFWKKINAVCGQRINEKKKIGYVMFYATRNPFLLNKID